MWAVCNSFCSNICFSLGPSSDYLQSSTYVQPPSSLLYTRDPGAIPIAIFYTCIDYDNYYQALSYVCIHIHYYIVSMIILTYSDLI